MLFYTRNSSILDIEIRKKLVMNDITNLTNYFFSCFRKLNEEFSLYCS